MATQCIVRSCLQLAPSSPSSAVRAFLQLTPRRSLYATPPLDFLVPSLPATALRYRRTSEPLSLNDSRHAKRGFTSLTRRQQTTAIVNPRQDDDGQDMRVEITTQASNRLKEIMAKDSNPNLALRIQVESGGCHGFQYLMSLTTLPPLNTSSISEEELPALNASSSDPNAMPHKPPTSPLFISTSSGAKEAKLDEDDTVFAADDGSGAKIIMDGPSLELLKGSKVDFEMALIGSQFKIVDNPLATSSCGCGTSFDIKV